MMTLDPEQSKSPMPDTAANQHAAQPAPPGPAEIKMETILGTAKGPKAASKEVPDETGSAPAVGSNSGDSGTLSPEIVEASTAEGKLPPHTEPQPPKSDQPSIDEVNGLILSESGRQTRRSFVVAAAAAAAGYGLYQWIDRLPADEMQPEGYRRSFETNADISRALFDDRALSPTYPISKSENLRVNGVYGLKKMLDPTGYRLQLVGSNASTSHSRYSRDVTAWEYVYVDEKAMEDEGHDTKTPPPSARTSDKMPPDSMVEQEKQNESRSGRISRGKEEAGESRSALVAGTPGLLLTMEDVLKLPRHELVTQFKCIEGWSQIVHWAGVRMVDFMEAYPPAIIDGKEPKYVYMETPDGDYYTGYDLNVCRHPQTLLVTEMMGAPLTQYHGAPLRLHMPTKYGYKQIKRIGLISYADSKSDDYWTKLGYDWYAGL
jgi:hypothetical protein